MPVIPIKLILLVAPTLIIFLTYTTTSYAAYPSTDSEFAKLPKYCSARFSRPGTNPNFWQQKIGRRNWTHLHHYCNALNSINKASETPKPDKKKDNLTKAIRTLKDVISKTEPKFILRPELFLKLGESYSKLRQYSEAIGSFTSALKIKANYSSAYASMSDTYKIMGEKDKAIEVLKNGLKHKPNSKRLKRRLEKLKY
ncbi:MAG: tetratricopeptide repeat protein [Planctomycetes bacterium]|nr:tetratricopeptide repeat protein [Planctomycetota bacterium]